MRGDGSDGVGRVETYPMRVPGKPSCGDADWQLTGDTIM